jgi:plastocyanin
LNPGKVDVVLRAMTTTLGTRRRWLTIALALAVLAFALALAGLRGESAAAGGTAQASRVKTVDIDGFAYHPPTLRIAAGSKVDFANSSGVTHTATRAGSFSSGRIKPGHSVSVRFKQRGTFAYHCTIHPFMHGKIVVE